MSRVYFDITDIIQFAGRNTRLTGIQRVVFNIVNLLSRRHGGDAVRCVYFDRGSRSMYEVDLSARAPESEFDAEMLLVDLGLASSPGFLPSRVRMKSYLRNHSTSKLGRELLKYRLYLWSLFARDRLRALDLLPAARPRDIGAALGPVPVATLPADSHLVYLGSTWFFPEVWQFAAGHRARGGDVVQFVHDLIPVTHPQFMPEKEPPVFAGWLGQAMDYAARFPCNSRWTADSLVRHAGRAGRTLKVDVTSLAHEFIGYPRFGDIALPPRLASLAGRRFVLCVGTIEARKNGVSLLQAWRQAMAGMPGAARPALVFAGRYGKIGGAEFRAALRSPGEAEEVHVIDMPSDHELAWLYRNCLFTVYPSYVEGWGLPVGESVWFGKHCVASNASSIPEVCGDLIDYVDPHDVASIRAGIERPLADAAYLRERERLIAAAPMRGWGDVADDLFAYVRG